MLASAAVNADPLPLPFRSDDDPLVVVVERLPEPVVPPFMVAVPPPFSSLLLLVRSEWPSSNSSSDESPELEESFTFTVILLRPFLSPDSLHDQKRLGDEG